MVVKKLTKEEESLLKDFSPHQSKKMMALFYGNGLCVSALPVWLYFRIHLQQPNDAWPFWAAMTLISTYLLSFAYCNMKFVLKHKIAQKRQVAIMHEVSKQIGSGKGHQKDKDDRILMKKNDVSDSEATFFSLFYNNLLFLFLVVFLSFFVFFNATPNVNYVMSIGISAGLVALFTTGSQNK